MAEPEISLLMAVQFDVLCPCIDLSCCSTSLPAVPPRPDRSCTAYTTVSSTDVLKQSMPILCLNIMSRHLYLSIGRRVSGEARCQVQMKRPPKERLVHQATSSPPPPGAAGAVTMAAGAGHIQSCMSARLGSSPKAPAQPATKKSVRIGISLHSTFFLKVSNRYIILIVQGPISHIPSHRLN